MFDIGGLELLLITVVALLVIGPERLPETLRTLGLWLGRLRRSFTAVKAEIEKEIGMDEVKRQLHNEAVMEEMKRIEQEVQTTADQATIDPTPNRNPKPEPESAPAPDQVAPVPRTEAQVEAAYTRKTQAQKTGTEDDS